jgi:hypothetical protein
VSANSIDGFTGVGDICDHWYEHYRKLLNTCKDFSVKTKVLNDIKSGSNAKDSVYDPFYT